MTGVLSTFMTEQVQIILIQMNFMPTQKLPDLNKQNLKILGLMSGTSCDGLDIALIDIIGSGIKTKFSFIAGKSIAYKKDQKKLILSMMQPPKANAQNLSQFNFYLAHLWSDMIKIFLKEIKLKASQIDLIGSHGQTIWHQPGKQLFNDKQISSTLQLGDPSVLAQLTTIPVIGDFRVADMALGGQGAPLIPYFDWIYFSKFKENILAVNIGGISNVTFIPDNGNFYEVQAFDCGPGNVLIDQAMLLFYDKPFDRDGSVARQGNLAETLFDYIKMKDRFILSKPPKSTGREQYNEEFLKDILNYARDNRIKKSDIIRTLTEYTAFAIFENYISFISPQYFAESLINGGGGANNSFLMEQLQKYFEHAEVKKTDDYGLDNDFKEAIGFAVFANETIKGKTSNMPHLTGAKKPAVLGKICLI